MADDTGPFSGFPYEFSFDAPTINDTGKVAFVATLNAGGSGIFTGPDVIADKVIATGDQLLGSTVTSVSLSREGLNDAAQIAFYVLLADGRQAVVRADPSANVDIAATSLTINGGLVSYGWSITGADLPNDTSVALYWSDNDTFEPGNDTLAFSSPIQGADRQVGNYSASISVGDLVASSAPQLGTTHLLLVADPPMPNGVISELDETNNVKPFALLDRTVDALFS